MDQPAIDKPGDIMSEKNTPAPEDKSTFPCRPITVAGERLPVSVTQDGVFICQINKEQFIRRASYADVQRDAILAYEKSHVKVRVPFTHLEYGIAYPAFATGIHALTGGILIVSGSREKELSNESYNAITPLTPEEMETYRVLSIAENVAAAALRDFKEAHKIKLRKLVQEAIDQAIAKPKEG